MRPLGPPFLLLALAACATPPPPPAAEDAGGAPIGDAGIACTVGSCTQGQYCDPVTGTCLFGCDEPRDCGPDEGCEFSSHSCVCQPGFHRCGPSCRADGEPSTCGTRCSPCPGDPNGTATCSAGSCGVTCNATSLRCGSACAACPAGATATRCAQAACEASACEGGRLLCQGSCPSCPAGAATTACAGAACEARSCQGGRLLCQGQCPLCPGQASATACAADLCIATACHAGYALCGGGCVPCAPGQRFCCRERVDPAAGTGPEHALALDGAGVAVVAYEDSAAKGVKLARGGPGGFAVRTVDSGDVGKGVSLALDSAGNAHLAYARTAYPFAVKYAFVPVGGGAVRLETIETGLVEAGATAIGLDSAGEVHVAYFASGDAHHAVRKSGGWQVGYAMHDGRQVSMAIAGTTPHLVASSNPAYGAQVSVLTYGYASRGLPDGGLFVTGRVSSTLGVSVYHSATIAVDDQGAPSIAWQHPSFRDLRLSTRDGGLWQEEVVDPTLAGAPSLRACPSGPCVAYVTLNAVRYAERVDGGWRSQTVDNRPITVGTVSLAVADKGAPHVTLFDPDPAARGVYYVH